MEKDVDQFVDFSTKKTRMGNDSEVMIWVLIGVVFAAIALVLGGLYQNGIIQ